jgi:ribokinase
MSGHPRVLVVGYNACDITVALPRLPDPDTKLEVPPILLGGGGPAATAAVALARLGADVRLLTPLTDDEAGRLQRRELVAAGVDIAPCPVIAGAESAKAVILVHPPDGARTILWSRGALPNLPSPAEPERLLEGRDLLYLDGHEPTASLALARVARERGLPVIMDAGTLRAGSRELVPLCTDVVSSAVFAPAFAGCGDLPTALRALRAAGPERVALTLGAAGVMYLAGQAIATLPAFAVEAVDTTGAGDAFHAGYAYARGRGDGFVAALRFGAAVAALKCRDWGGRRGLPTLAETEALLASGRTRPPGPFPDAAGPGGPA